VSRKNSLHFFLLLMTCILGAHAVAQQARLSPTSLNFGPITPGNSTAPQTMTLSNDGSADLVVGAIATSGGFSQANNCSTLRSGERCTIDVTYISAILGSTKGVLTINDNSATSPEIVSLSGSVIPPVALSPAKLGFGSVAVGSSVIKALTLTASGSAFSIATINTSGDYAQTNYCPATLSGGDSCTINVIFRPRSNGTRAGVLAVASQNPGFTGSLSGYSAALSGTGTGGTQVSQVSLQPAVLNFGPKSPFDEFQHTQTVQLMNISANRSLTIHSVTALGPIYNLVPFYQIASTDCVGILAPGAQCSIQVVQSTASTAFPPLNAAGSLTIVDSDNSGPNVVPLAASILPELQFSPVSLSFPAQAVGTTSTAKIVTVSYDVDRTGVSLRPMSITSEFNLVPAGTNPCGLSPGFNPRQSCTVGVTFTPKHAGVISGAVSFTMYPECDPQRTILEHQPCPNAQVINLLGTGK
jgi:Abnormal spindle-like microcephaly-assoc'd, ASPM-SPD-2-Hydin